MASYLSFIYLFVYLFVFLFLFILTPTESQNLMSLWDGRVKEYGHTRGKAKNLRTINE